MERIQSLIEEQFTENYLGMESIPATGKIDDRTEILKTYLGSRPDRPYFGSILSVMRHDDRFFVLAFHVWRAGQKASNANRLSDIQELRVGEHYGIKHLEHAETNFGLRAFWQNTPDSVLDPNAVVLRTVARVLKRYSVSNKLCARFRKEHAAFPAKSRDT